MENYAKINGEKEYKKWLEYHYGFLDYESLSKFDKQNIDAFDYVMYSLVPEEKLEMLKDIYGLTYNEMLFSETMIYILTNCFKVPKEVVFFRIREAIKKENNSRKILKNK